MIKIGNRVHKNKIEGIVIKVRDNYAWVQYGNNGMFIEAFPVEKLISRKESAARIIQSVSRKRLEKLQQWIASQRNYLDLIYNNIKKPLREWSKTSTNEFSRRLLNAIYGAPPPLPGTPGYIYRKVVVYPPRGTLDLNFTRASSWSLNPLFAASFKMDAPASRHLPDPEQVLLRLPLNTPASKLYIGDTSKLLNSTRRSVHAGNFALEAEVILAPVNLRIIRSRRIPLGTVTGISSTGKSEKRLSIAASSAVYGTQRSKYRMGYHPPPPESVSTGINKQQTLITVLDVKER